MAEARRRASTGAEITGSVADAVRGSFVDTLLPAPLRPFARLARWDRPIGWRLLLAPCWWSAALAAVAAGHRFPDPWHLVLFLIGAIAMRGAGCTWNDIVDRDIDAAVARTRSRPLPSGQVGLGGAVGFLLAQALVGLAVLLQFNGFAVLLGLTSLAVVALYPFAKRVTDWPQVVLGLAFSWGALMGWAAALGRLDAAPIALYAGAVAWTVGYDTIYAHQDKDDDAVIGVRSTARLFAERTRPALVAFYGLAVAGIGLSFALVQAGVPAYAGLAAFALHLGWQVKRLDIHDPEQCRKLFISNRCAGWLPFLGLLADAAL